MTASDIEWTDATWNPLGGCSIVSPGCSNCYAMRMAARLQAMGQRKYAGTTRKSGRRHVWSGRVNLDGQALRQPLRWRHPRRVFVNSMSDLFQEAVSAAFVRRVWEVMEQAHWHTYQILTKRPKRMRDLLGSGVFQVLANVWLGTSVEGADYLSRLDELRRTPAAVRFVSFEPLLGPVGRVDLSDIDWAIVGGESGPGARDMDPDWVDEIHRACQRQGSEFFFFKQWGGARKKTTGRLLKGRTWDEYPASVAAAV